MRHGEIDLAAANQKPYPPHQHENHYNVYIMAIILKTSLLSLLHITTGALLSRRYLHQNKIKNLFDAFLYGRHPYLWCKAVETMLGLSFLVQYVVSLKSGITPHTISDIQYLI